MSFVIVEYVVNLTREEVAGLLLDNKDVETNTVDGEKVVLMGIGTHKISPDKGNGGILHEILTNVDFVGHEKYLWCSIVLTTKDGLMYTGHITPVH